MTEQGKTGMACACGAVKVEASGKPGFSVFCHCDLCRKISAAPFFWGTGYPKEAVKITGADGQEADTVRIVLETNPRHSCAACGTLVFEDSQSQGMYILPATLLDKPAPAQSHIFVSQAIVRLPDDGLPRFEGLPPM